jgi:influenza virus NS1A-binding protein
MITTVNKSMESIDENETSNVFVFEDKEYHSNIFDNLNMLRRNRQFCDVILQIGNQQDIHEIYAHKVVLSSASPYLLEMFSTDSSSPTIQTYKLLNGNYDIEAFDYVVDYAYSARLEVPNDKVRDVYAVANRLKMSLIAFQCGQYLLSTLTPDNCLNVRSIRGVLNDQFLLSSVDNYIRQNMLQIVQSKCLDTLSKVQVEFLLNSDEERAATNEKHVFNMVLDWIHRSFDREELNLLNISEKMFMLYFNKNDKILHDCNEIENGANDDSDIIQDYKRLSRRLSFPTKAGTIEGQNGHHHNNNNATNGHKPTPSKSRQFLFTRSDSESSLSSLAEDDNENDWKVLATCVSGKHTLIGLVTVMGKLFVLTVNLRVNSPINSPNGSRHHSLEKTESYCLVPPMSSARCAVGTAELEGKLFVCG